MKKNSIVKKKTLFSDRNRARYVENEDMFTNPLSFSIFTEHILHILVIHRHREIPCWMEF